MTFSLLYLYKDRVKNASIINTSIGPENINSTASTKVPDLPNKAIKTHNKIIPEELSNKTERKKTTNARLKENMKRGKLQEKQKPLEKNTNSTKAHRKRTTKKNPPSRDTKTRKKATKPKSIYKETVNTTNTMNQSHVRHKKKVYKVLEKQMSSKQRLKHTDKESIKIHRISKRKTNTQRKENIVEEQIGSQSPIKRQNELKQKTKKNRTIPKKKQRLNVKYLDPIQSEKHSKRDTETVSKCKKEKLIYIPPKKSKLDNMTCQVIYEWCLEITNQIQCRENEESRAKPRRKQTREAQETKKTEKNQNTGGPEIQKHRRELKRKQDDKRRSLVQRQTSESRRRSHRDGVEPQQTPAEPESQIKTVKKTLKREEANDKKDNRKSYQDGKRKEDKAKKNARRKQKTIDKEKKISKDSSTSHRTNRIVVTPRRADDGNEKDNSESQLDEKRKEAKKSAKRNKKTINKEKKRTEDSRTRHRTHHIVDVPRKSKVRQREPIRATDGRKQGKQKKQEKN